MSKIVSKLDLNKTPQLADNTSLVFAKNIRLLKDGIIGPDFPIDIATSITGSILGYIVGLNSTIYLFVDEPDARISTTLFRPIVQAGGVVTAYSLHIENKVKQADYVCDLNNETIDSFVSNTLIDFFGGKIEGNTGPGLIYSDFVTTYLFASTIKVSYSYRIPTEVPIRTISETTTIKFPIKNKYNIYKYDEATKALDKINSAWTWSGGKIHGVCTTNNTNEIILTICEYFEDNYSEQKYVPIKHINLSHCQDTDDETIYTQTPNIPFTNLELVGTYISPIPNGVYQFFIRYKIYDNYYTSWFSCSGECFAGTKNLTHTIQGSIQYIDTTLNSNESFIFSVKHLLNGENNTTNYVKNFKEFQIGFIVSHDDSVQARTWKHFPMDTDKIYFDYNQSFIEEINIDDLLKSTYEIFNVKNVSYFRDKLYISNYIESNINEDLTSDAFNIDVILNQIEFKTNDGTQINPDTITINNRILNKIAGTNLYSFGWLNDGIITKTITQTSIDTGDNFSGNIYNLYNKVYAVAEIQALFIKSGCSLAIIDDNTDLELLPSFCLVPSTKYHNYFRNSLFDEDMRGHIIRTIFYYTYTRPNVASNTVEQYTIDGFSEKQNILGHPLNSYDLEWICAPMFNTNVVGKTYDYDINVHGAQTNTYIRNIKASNDNNEANRTYTTSGNGDINEETVRTTWNDAEKALTDFSILSYIKKYYPKYVIKTVKYYCDNEESTLYGANNDTKTISVEIEDDNDREDHIVSATNKPYNDFRGITSPSYGSRLSDRFKTVNDIDAWCENTYIAPSAIDIYGNTYFYDEVRHAYRKIDKVVIEYNEFSYSLGEVTYSLDTVEDDNKDYSIIRKINSSVKVCARTIKYSSPTLNTNITDSINLKSLLPFTKYNFYVHYIKSNGVVTNGYLIGKEVELLNNGVPYFNESYTHSIIYPYFTGMNIPDGYCGVFYSIEKVGDNIASCFNHRIENGEHIVDCLDIDSMIYPLTDHITIIDSDGQIVTTDAKYYPSSTTDPAILLGNVGSIRWDVAVGETTPSETKRYWVRIFNNVNVEDTNRLIRITPYLRNGDYYDYINMNLPGYYSTVYKPKDAKSTNDKYYYVNGSDIYEKTDNNGVISVDEYNNLLSHIQTGPYYVYSNFNLSYLGLFDTSHKLLHYKTAKETTQQGVEIAKVKQVLFMLDSSTISYIYTLPSMYKDYTRKLYSSKQDNKLFRFDNVIRSSDANTDESYKYIYRFDAIDYYNVPANKGIIINLFAIEKNLYIHCEHSLYKFVGNNTLTARDTEVQLTESDIFDTGISELFDAEHGFAGIKYKHHALVTFNAYIFYDSIANIIYGYFGNNNLVNISETITKILKHNEIKDVRFSNDANNDRFFVNIIYNDDKNICLSFNFNTKSFVSIHDFDFLESFSSRGDCYFLDNTKRKIYAINNVGEITNYSDLYKLSKLVISDMSYDNNTVENCLDIICNVDYEKIKALNYINWVCSQINKYVEDNNLFVAEEDISKYPGTKLRIYSDQCSTDLIELTDANGVPYEQNTQNLYSPNSYKYPRYNCGIWSLNYFRDVRNIEDIFNYKNSLPASAEETTYNAGVTPMYKRGLVESDKSLIYGKYFVVRFIFKNKNFKLENLIFNIQDYEKV